ncbi:MAG: insulinase family protein [Saprospiraceae bacterium]|nr:insulinase family protein [Saprospiraceae bacterium]
MKSHLTYLFFLLFFLSNHITWAQNDPIFSPDDIDIPYKKYVLSNGLRLIVHEDHKAPIVAVNVWYHVGSKNEKVGKSGFAHLFEHLMFNGSENFNDDYFQALERIGGTDLNGTTNTDRTNYFQNVPLAALDQVLWLESDRMGHLLGAIDQAKLDEQRGVVQNEKRQGENQPYGLQWELMQKAMFPKGHPYSWTTIGEMEDLNAASLEDVHEWFKSYYGAANAVIAVAGDVKPEAVYEKVQKYFGDIAPGPTLVRPEVNIPVRTRDTRQSFQDRVPESRVVMAWNTPEWGTEEDAYLNLAANILSSGKTSRLYKKLIYQDQTASSAAAFTWTKEIAGNFIIQANVKPGVEIDVVENTINEILEEFLKNGPNEQELNRVKAEYFSGFIKGIERIGGFGGKSDILAQNEVYGKSPDFYKETLDIIAKATPADIQKVANRWLSQGRHTLICTPFPDYAAATSSLDRSQGPPPLGEPAAAKFPDLQRTRLSNGLEVILAKREGVPTIVMDMMFDAGYAADKAEKAGTASLAMNMIDEGTQSRNALQINEELQMLGASLFSSADLDASYISMNTLKPSLDASLDLFADVVMNPSFPQSDFDRLKNQRMVQIQREKSTPIQMALRVFPKYFYGEDHAYSMPFTGSGHEATVQAMTREDVMQYYTDWIKPNNATLIVVGDVEMAALKAKLESRFKGWEKGKTPKKNIARVTKKSTGTLYLMDRPESQQSVIFGGYLVDPYGKVSEIARESMINILGGDFTSRLNMNLREDKHWAYGAGTFLPSAKGQRPMIAYAPVQTDKTKESIQEIIKEFEMFVDNKPITQEEFDKVTKNTVLQLPGQWETNNAVSNSLNELVKYKLDDNYFQTYDKQVRGMDLSDVRQLAKKLVRPDDLQFFVVGDKAKVLPGLKELGFENIIVLDADGNPVKADGKAKP